MWQPVRMMLENWLHEILDPGLSAFTFGAGLFSLLFDSGLVKTKRLAKAELFYLWIGAIYMILGLSVWLYIQFH